MRSTLFKFEYDKGGCVTTDYINLENVNTVELMEYQKGNPYKLTLGMKGGVVYYWFKIDSETQLDNTERIYKFMEAWEKFGQREKI